MYSVTDIKNCIQVSQDAIVLGLEITPNSHENEFHGINKWRKTIQVRIREPAKDGKANRELVDFLAGVFLVTSMDIDIVSGEKTHQKRVRVSGIGEDLLVETLLGELDG